MNRVVKRDSNAEDAVKLVIETAWAFRDSPAVESLLSAVPPFTPSLRWFERLFWQIDQMTTYKFDQSGREQIKTPDRFIKDTTGDCDDYSTLWLAILFKLGIRAYPKIVNYHHDPYWDHIYVIVPLRSGQTNGLKYLVLDNVYAKYYKKFNVEVEHVASRTFDTTKKQFYGLFTT